MPISKANVDFPLSLIIVILARQPKLITSPSRMDAPPCSMLLETSCRIQVMTFFSSSRAISLSVQTLSPCVVKYMCGSHIDFLMTSFHPINDLDIIADRMNTSILPVFISSNNIDWFTPDLPSQYEAASKFAEDSGTKVKALVHATRSVAAFLSQYPLLSCRSVTRTRSISSRKESIPYLSSPRTAHPSPLS